MNQRMMVEGLFCARVAGSGMCSLVGAQAFLHAPQSAHVPTAATAPTCESFLRFIIISSLSFNSCHHQTAHHRKCFFCYIILVWWPHWGTLHSLWIFERAIKVYWFILERQQRASLTSHTGNLNCKANLRWLPHGMCCSLSENVGAAKVESSTKNTRKSFMGRILRKSRSKWGSAFIAP